MRLLLPIALILFSSSVRADSNNPYQPEPFPEERLSHAIILSNCTKVSIIEWRGSGGQPSSAPSDKATEIINQVCELVLEGFPKFLEMQNINISINYSKFHQKLALMPFHGQEGFSFRNLNDTKFRFKFRSDPPIEVFGYTHYKTKTIYMRNDVLLANNKPNPRFITIFAHEMYHALSSHFGLVDSPEIEEFQAERFTRFLKLGS